MIPQKLASASASACRVTGLVLAAAFHTAWLSQPLGWPLTTFHLAFLIIAVVRPAYALLVLAGLAPLTMSLAILLRSPRPGASVLAAMLWACATGALVRPVAPVPGSRLKGPATLLAIVAVGSAIVATAGHPLFISGHPGVRSAAAALLSGALVEGVWPWIPLQLAVVTVMALFTAVTIERLIRSDRDMAVRLIRLLIVGHAAAVAISVSRLVSAAVREEQIPAALVRLLSDVRYHSQYDVNAAGSTLVIVACAGLGLLAARRSLAALLPVPVVLTGVWLTGSRAALVALVGVVVLKVSVEAFATRRRLAWIGAAAAIVAVVVVSAALYAFYPSRRNVPTSVAYESRLVMLRTAWRAGLSDPLFGVGIGCLPERGQEFGSAEMTKFLGPGGLRENAHNQYLQVFAELGALGIVAFALVVGSVGWTPLWKAADDPLLSWTAWGLVASMLTWILGHPLLVPEAAVIFWLFIGIVAGLNAKPVTDTRGWRLTRIAAIVLAGLVVIVTPLRASHAAREASLEHRGIGVSSDWRDDDEVSYRSAGRRFTLFLPSSRAVAIPMRATQASAARLVLDVYLRGELIDSVEISSEVWRRIRIVLPRSDRRFEPVEFVLGPADQATSADIIRVGKATDLGPAFQ